MEFLFFCLAVGLLVVGLRAVRKRARRNIDEMEDGDL